MKNKKITKEIMIQEYNEITKLIIKELEYIKESEEYIPNEKHTYKNYINSDNFKTLKKFTTSNWKLQKMLKSNVQEMVDKATKFLEELNNILALNLEMM